MIAMGLVQAAFASDVLWTNSLGGAWSNGVDWSTGAVPGPSDNAITNLDSGATFDFIVVDVTNFPVRFFRAKQ